MICIPVWERYGLSIEEAAVYFRVGENRLRELLADNEDADYAFHVGNRTVIKRRKFAEFLDTVTVI